MKSQNSLLQDNIKLPLDDKAYNREFDNIRFFSRSFDKTYDNILKKKPPPASPSLPGFFLSPGKTFLKQIEGKTIPYDSKTIILEQILSEKTYTANEYGYLYVDNSGQICIKSCIQPSLDKMKLIFFILPVKCGKKEFRAHINLRFTEYHQLENEIFIADDFLEKSFLENRIQAVTIKEGTPPIEGRNAELIMHIKPEEALENQKKNPAHFFSNKAYLEISKGELIAELILKKEGTPGKDVFGNKINPQPVEDIIFNQGENVETRLTEDKKKLFIAGISGLLDFHTSRVNIIETIDIAGDVGPETGDIDFSKSIYIHGGVHAGFSVRCGEDLTIDGNIENGSSIKCKGNLIVNGGILGRDTNVYCEGKARVWFIENARLYTEGDLHVKKYTYSAHIFCRDQITVEGNHISDKNQSAVIGGYLCSMKKMFLHSLGSRSSKTHIAIGKNEDVIEAVKKINIMLPVIEQKIIRLSLRLDTTQLKRYGSLQAVASHAERDHIINILKQTKVFFDQKKELTNKRDELFRHAYAENPDDIQLEIRTRIIPDVYLVMMKRSIILKIDYEKVRFYLQNENIKTLKIGE